MIVLLKLFILYPIGFVLALFYYSLPGLVVIKLVANIKGQFFWGDNEFLGYAVLVVSFYVMSKVRIPKIITDEVRRLLDKLK